MFLCACVRVRVCTRVHIPYCHPVAECMLLALSVLLPRITTDWRQPTGDSVQGLSLHLFFSLTVDSFVERRDLWYLWNSVVGEGGGGG